MEVNSSAEILPAVPPASFGINVNFCKNPHCANFGVPADVVKYRRRTGTLVTTPGTAYGLVAIARDRPALKCLLCNEIFSIKSNLAVAEELTRFRAYLKPRPAICCKTLSCPNRSISIEAPGAYQRFGVTTAGTPRYRCRLCRKTLTGRPKALHRQRITAQNKTILMALTNKMPLRRICKVAGINAVTLYSKINFIHRQCLAFAAHREAGLKSLSIPRLYISVDRQVYFINWGDESDRRNIAIWAVGSADNVSGYVFGMHPNFDPGADPVQIKRDAAVAGDATLPHPHRGFARLWLPDDYEASVASKSAEEDRKAAKAKRGPIGKSIEHVVEDSYEAAAIREDVEVSALKGENEKLPDANGMLVHEEYCLYGHFHFLKSMLPSTGKLRFFLDQDSGIRAACFSAFSKEIQERTVDVFYVKTAKEITIDKKRSLVSASNKRFAEVQKSLPLVLSEYQVKILMMKAEIAKSVQIGQWDDSWCAHPQPTMSEPAKGMCWLTNLEGYDEDHVARLFLHASLAGIDNFFQRVRRSLNPLERPIHTASGKRIWHGYAPYNPELVEKLLDIYRTVVNYVEVGKDGKTAAMRLGLAKAAIVPEDILYFTGA